MESTWRCELSPQILKLSWEYMGMSGKPPVPLLSRSHDSMWMTSFKSGSLLTPSLLRTAASPVKSYSSRCLGSTHLVWIRLLGWGSQLSAEIYRILYPSFLLRDQALWQGFHSETTHRKWAFGIFQNSSRFVARFEILPPGVSDCISLFPGEVYTQFLVFPKQSND